MSKEDDNAVFKGTTSEDVRLENLGYEQGMFPRRNSLLARNQHTSPELKRSFGLLGMIGFSFSVVTS